MKKIKALSLILSMFMLVSVAACSNSGTSDGEASASTAATAAGTTGGSAAAPAVDTITMWSNDTHDQSVYNKVIEDFNNTTGKEKGIVVNYTVYGSDYYNALDVAVTAGEGPDIFKSNKVGKYSEAGYIMPWDDIPALKTFVDRFAGYNAPGYGLFGGKTYAVPIRVTNYGLALNMDIFKKNNLKEPATWDEMREAAKVITKNGKGQIYGYDLAMGYGSYNYFYVNLPSAATTGDEYFNHTTGKYDFVSLEGFFNHLRDIIKDGSMFPGFETMDGDTARAQFSAGNIGMVGVMSSDVATFKNQFPCNFEWKVIPYPVKDASQHYKYPTGVSLSYVISSNVAKKGVQDKVADFLNVLYSDKTFVDTYQNQFDISILGDEITSKASVDKLDPNWVTFSDMDIFAIKKPNPDSDLSIEGESYQDVYNKIITGMADVHTALADLDKRYNEALDVAVKDGKVKIENYIDKNISEKMAWTK